MSTIRVDNFGPSAGGTTYSARGIAKAWVNFNGTGTIATRDSENVSSLVDDGTGDYTVNFSSVFTDLDYCVAGSIRYNSGIAFDGVFSIETIDANYISVLSVYGGTKFDSAVVCVSATGDLA